MVRFGISPKEKCSDFIIVLAMPFSQVLLIPGISYLRFWSSLSRLSRCSSSLFVQMIYLKTRIFSFVVCFYLLLSSSSLESLRLYDVSARDSEHLTSLASGICFLKDVEGVLKRDA